MKTIYLLLAILCFLLLFFIKKIENFEDNKSIQVVVSRYNENLDWLKEEPYTKFSNYVIYNKGVNDDFYRPPNSKIIKLDNVGKCDHTFLYHIIENYDNLYDITIFLPGSCNVQKKINCCKGMLNNVLTTNKATMVNFNRNKENNIRDKLGKFHIEEYENVSEENRSLYTNKKVYLSKYRPYGKWYDHYIKYKEPVNQYSYWSIFSVSKKDILNNEKEYYESLNEELSLNPHPEAGHFMERSWFAIFSPLNDTDIIVNPICGD